MRNQDKISHDVLLHESSSYKDEDMDITRMRTEHPQKEVIDVLLRNSKEFQAFYSDNKTTLEKLRIHWYVNPNLVNGLCKPLNRETYEIVLNSIPSQKEKAMVVAHELYHCILCYSRYPILRGFRVIRCQGIMAALMSMVYDSYINLKLRDYFGNGCQLIKLSSQQYFENKLKNRKNIGDESEIGTLFLFVNFQLIFEILCNTADIQDSNFFRWFDRYRPDIVTKSIELISLIKSTNMDEPEYAKELFQEIIKRYPSLEPIQVV